MKSDIDIKQLLSAVDVPAQWVGLREVYEAHTPRMIRDGVPVANGRAFTHGIMVEVLVNGQFGYYGTPNMTPEGISSAAKRLTNRQTLHLAMRISNLMNLHAHPILVRMFLHS